VCENGYRPAVYTPGKISVYCLKELDKVVTSHLSTPQDWETDLDERCNPLEAYPYNKQGFHLRLLNKRLVELNALVKLPQEETVVLSRDTLHAIKAEIAALRCELAMFLQEKVEAEAFGIYLLTMCVPQPALNVPHTGMAPVCPHILIAAKDRGKLREFLTTTTKIPFPKNSASCSDSPIAPEPSPSPFCVEQNDVNNGGSQAAPDGPVGEQEKRIAMMKLSPSAEPLSPEEIISRVNMLPSLKPGSEVILELHAPCGPGSSMVRNPKTNEREKRRTTWVGVIMSPEQWDARPMKSQPFSRVPPEMEERAIYLECHHMSQHLSSRGVKEFYQITLPAFEDPALKPGITLPVFSIQPGRTADEIVKQKEEDDAAIERKKAMSAMQRCEVCDREVKASGFEDHCKSKTHSINEAAQKARATASRKTLGVEVLRKSAAQSAKGGTGVDPARAAPVKQEAPPPGDPPYEKPASRRRPDDRFNSQSSTLFRNHCPLTPGAAVGEMLGAQFAEITLLEEMNQADITAEAKKGVEMQTHNTRMKFLRVVQREAKLNPRSSMGRICQAAILNYKDFDSKEGDLQWSTVKTYLETMEVALSQIQIYSDYHSPIKLSQDPEWHLFRKWVQQQALHNTKWRKSAASKYEVARAVANLRRDAATALALGTPAGEARAKLLETAAVVMILTWAVCGRVGDVLQLMPQALEFEPPQEKDPTVRFFKLTFIRGKLASLVRRSHCVRSSLPLETADWVEGVIHELTRKLPPKGWTFGSQSYRKKVQATMVQYLRQENPTLESYSLRRGALQELASKPGMTLQQILYFSGHTSESMLLTYLGWGRLADGVTEHQALIARCLTANWPGEVLDHVIPPLSA
jgi:hypothetical protein